MGWMLVIVVSYKDQKEEVQSGYERRFTITKSINECSARGEGRTFRGMG